MKIREMLKNQIVWQGLMSRKMPAKVAYAIAKNMQKVDPEIKLYNETRLKLLGENWKMDEDGEKFVIPPADEAKWQAMLDELLDVDVDLAPHMLDFSQLEPVELTPQEILALDFMIAQ